MDRPPRRYALRRAAEVSPRDVGQSAQRSGTTPQLAEAKWSHRLAAHARCPDLTYRVPCRSAAYHLTTLPRRSGTEHSAVRRDASLRHVPRCPKSERPNQRPPGDDTPGALQDDENPNSEPKGIP